MQVTRLVNRLLSIDILHDKSQNSTFKRQFKAKLDHLYIYSVLTSVKRIIDSSNLNSWKHIISNTRKNYQINDYVVFSSYISLVTTFPEL